MDEDGLRPDTPAPAEIVHQSGRTRIIRLDGGTVIRKEPLGPDAERRVRHERAMLERLRGVAGVAQLARTSQYPGSVLLADAGGADARRGSGLTGLRDRVEAVGGSMTVDSPAGAGTVLTVQLPVTRTGRGVQAGRA